MVKVQERSYEGRAYIGERRDKVQRVYSMGIVLPPAEESLQYFYNKLGIRPDRLPGTRSLDALMESDGTVEVGHFIEPTHEDQLRKVLPTTAQFYWSGSARGFRVYLTRGQVISLVAAIKRMGVNWYFDDWCGRVSAQDIQNGEKIVNEFLEFIRRPK